MTEKSMISVHEAEDIVLSQALSLGAEAVELTKASGRVLASGISADRDLPPFDRVMMDGIAVRFEAVEKGIDTFRIRARQAAGDEPSAIDEMNQCIEIMTGASLPPSTDTIIPYEHLLIQNGEARLVTGVVHKHQSIHFKGSDKRNGEEIVAAGAPVTAAVIGAAASVGQQNLLVKKLPSVVVISTGDELVDVTASPSPYQIRRSNGFCLQAILKQHQIDPDILHLRDDKELMERQIANCLESYQVLVLTGAVSMGRFDYLPEVLERLSVRKLFHKVQQRPGKPFWFGRRENQLVFAFPGNPVSAFLCMHRYFLPWLGRCLGIPVVPGSAVLGEDVSFAPSLTYFLQVTLEMNQEARLTARPAKGNGSGDFSSLVYADAFMELPSAKTNFQKGEVYPVWPCTKPIF